jgi:ATP-dependent Lon protease
MEREISVLQVEKRIRSRVKRQMGKTQREYYLNEQMKAIQKELGDEEDRDEFAEIEAKIKKTRLSKESTRRNRKFHATFGCVLRSRSWTSITQKWQEKPISISVR